jgi:O-methyltransferase
MVIGIKTALKHILPKPIITTLRVLQEPIDLFACISFLLNPSVAIALQDRFRLIKQLYAVTFSVKSPHTQKEVLSYIGTILALPAHKSAVVVEVGCFKGSSTAKFSLAADLVGKELVVFDSFQGIPDNDEPHDKNIFGAEAKFVKGDWCGPLEEVKNNVAKYGKINRCRFVPGWVDDTLPKFHEPILAIYIDVDLASSTRTCLKYLYPLLETGGVLYSQDGHLPLVIDVFNDEQFWLNEIGCRKPTIEGLGVKKLIKIVKGA